MNCAKKSFWTMCFFNKKAKFYQGKASFYLLFFSLPNADVKDIGNSQPTSMGAQYVKNGATSRRTERLWVPETFPGLPHLPSTVASTFLGV